MYDFSLKKQYNLFMKKFLTVVLLFFMTTNITFAAVDSATGEKREGYKGTLPDVTQRFDKQRSEMAKPQFDAVPGFNDKNELKPIPRDNPAYVDVMIKKKQLSPYTKDINDAIPLVEAIVEAINFELNIQKFVARVNYFNEWMDYFKDKYRGTPEAYYASYKQLAEVDFQSKYVATVKYESTVYNKYLPYNGEGEMYSPKSLDKQTQALLKELEKTLVLLKEVK